MPESCCVAGVKNIALYSLYLLIYLCSFLLLLYKILESVFQITNWFEAAIALEISGSYFICNFLVPKSIIYWGFKPTISVH